MINTVYTLVGGYDKGTCQKHTIKSPADYIISPQLRFSVPFCSHINGNYCIKNATHILKALPLSVCKISYQLHEWGNLKGIHFPRLCCPYWIKTKVPFSSSAWGLFTDEVYKTKTAAVTFQLSCPNGPFRDFKNK